MTRQYDNYGRDQNNVEYVQGNVTFNQTQIIQIAVSEIKTRPLNTTSPYRGLKPFAQTDKDYFFGRDQFLTGLVNELEQTNVILLLGASGSGKSSVVRAGLLPWLTQKWGSRLIDLTLTPDYDPFEALYGSLLKHYKQFEAQRARDGNADTLSQVVQTLKQPESFWLIFIDQFEELFTTSQSEKRDRFIQSLVQLSQERTNDQSLKIVATMRADFLDRLDLAPANRLARITEKHRPLITQMHPDELRLAIEQPAAHHGVVFEHGLVDQIIKDVQGQAGYLPLLQYTLNLLWNTELKADGFKERTLSLQTYRDLGDARGALQQHVDQFYKLLPRPEQQAVQKVFLKLVDISRNEELGEDWNPVRRRALKAEFGELEQTVLTKLINQSLLVSDLHPQVAEATVEIVHEVLLTSWTTLNGWIKDNRQAIALRNRLYEDVARWKPRKLDEELWSGSKLAKVLELRNDSNFIEVLGGFSQVADDFISASQSLRERQRRRIIIGLSGFTTVALTLAVIAVWQWNLAEKLRIRGLVESSRSQLEKDGQLDALLLAVEAGQQAKRFPSSLFIGGLKKDVESSLRQAVDKVKERNRLKLDSTIASVSFSPNDTYIAAGSTDSTISTWKSDGTKYQLGEYNALTTKLGSNNSNEQFVLFVDKERVVKRWRFEKGNQQPDLVASIPPQFEGFRFDPDGKYLVFWNANREISLLDTNANQSKIREIISADKNLRIDTINFSPDGQLLVAVSRDQNDNRTNRTVVEIWDAKDGFSQTGYKRIKYEDATANEKNDDKSISLRKVTAVAINQNPKNDLLISLGDEQGKIVVWNLSSNRAEACIDEGKNKDCHADYITDMQFNPNDRNSFATASTDGTIKYWQIQAVGELFKPKLLMTYKGHVKAVHSISFNKEGSRLISGGADETVRLWEVGNNTSFLDSDTSLQKLLKDGCDHLKDYLNNPNLSKEDRQLCK